MGRQRRCSLGRKGSGKASQLGGPLLSVFSIPNPRGNLRVSKAPAFQFYAADYLADEHVQVMTLEQEGIYIRLLSYCWRESSIPADIALLSRLCKNAPAESIQFVIERFEPHPERPDRLVHPRLKAERTKQAEFNELKARAGRKGARKRWGPEVPQRKHGRPIVLPMAKNSSSSSSSSSSSLLSADRELSDHTHSPPKPVCVSRSKFTLDQIRDYAWAQHHLAQKLIGQGHRQVEGIRNPDGWAVAAHRSGEWDELIKQWIEDPQRAVG